MTDSSQIVDIIRQNILEQVHRVEEDVKDLSKSLWELRREVDHLPYELKKDFGEEFTGKVKKMVPSLVFWACVKALGALLGVSVAIIEILDRISGDK